MGTGGMKSYTIEQPTAAFVLAQIDGIFYGCYARPNLTLTEFKHMLCKAVLDAKGWKPKVILDNDNAFATEWGTS